MKATGLNHVSIHAENLEASTRFYEEFFDLERIPTPDFGYPVQWMRLGDRQLHIFVRETRAPEFHHFAVEVDDFEAAYVKAKESGCFDGGPREFPDGSLQMYVRDPAGNRVEIDWPDASRLDLRVFGPIEKLAGPTAASVYDRQSIRRIIAKGLHVAEAPRVDAVRAGNTIYVTGMVAMNAQREVVGKGDIAEQARQVFRNLTLALAAAGASPRDIVKVTVFMRNISQRALVNSIRKEFFGDFRPASTMVEVSRLVDDDLLLEVDTIAVVGG